MIKQICIILFLSLFTFVMNPFAFEYQGRTITAREIKSLPPGAMEQVKQAISSQNSSQLQQTPSQTAGSSSKTEITEKNLSNADGINETESHIKKLKNNSSAKVSIIEQQYRKGYSSALSSKLKQFGYNIFSSATMRPSSLAVPGPDYLLGTGDQLFIRLWGSGSDAAYSGQINREGTINVPKIGIIQVAGVRYGDVESIIQREAQKYIQGINLSVTLTKLRSLEIYVVGDVRNPGLHIVPYFSTIFNGLVSAGGVKKSGTLRHIQLNRNKKTIRVLDLYDLLLRGKTGSDEILKNKDVIFVPGIGKTAAVAGAVNNEGIFELNKEKKVYDLVKLAGNLLPQAFGSRIYLRRFKDNKNFVVKDIDSSSPDEWKKVDIQDGDLLELPFSSSLLPNVVRLEGHVWAPDVFKFKKGMKLSDILTSPELLRPDAIMDFGLIQRYNPTTTRTISMRFPLSDVFKGKYDTELKSFDKIKILSRAELGITEKFSIEGAVWKTGTFNYQPEIRLKDALALAGGLKFGARKDKIEIARQVIKDNRIVTKYQVLDINKNGDFALQPYDSVVVPLIKDASFAKKVSISGEVAYPGIYTINNGEKLSDLIQRAGGFTDNAYFYGAKFTSNNARLIQQKSINQMIDQLQLSYIKLTSAQTQASISEQDVKAAAVSGKQIQSFIAKLKTIKASGRVAIRLADLSSFKNSIYDFTLQPGDALYIPDKPSFVSVVGSVYSPGSFLYESNKKLKFYLAKSGGITKTADEDHLYLLKANGEIRSMSQHSGFFSEFKNIVLMPGDTIVAPEDLERVPYLKLISDISDIAFKIATTAGVAVALSL